MISEISVAEKSIKIHKLYIEMVRALGYDFTSSLTAQI